MHIEDVIAALHRLDGTPIGHRLLSQLPGGRGEWRMRRELGAVVIYDRAYAQGSRTGIELVLARRDFPGVKLDATWVEQRARRAGLLAPRPADAAGPSQTP